MHSIASVRSSSGAADYFANDNYYTADEHAEAGVWGGEGARALGLEGQVERDQFEAILNGRLPNGEMVGQVEGRRLGLDLTFSMPKSASILALVSGDKRILDVHLAAVKSTMTQLVEKQFAESRNYDRSRSGELSMPSRAILVFTQVGHSAVTVTPVPASSAARVSDRASTAALVTL